MKSQHPSTALSPSHTLKHTINAQRVRLREILGNTLNQHARELPPLLGNTDALDLHLGEIFLKLELCKYIYALDVNGIQLSSTISRFGPDVESLGRDRSARPYMHHIHDENVDFNLSEAYISCNKKRPSLTAIQSIRDSSGKRVGFLGVDYDLRELPHSEVIYEEPNQWRQIKGDPAIRSGLFLQQRVESIMDRHIDDVLSVHEALILDQGVHHVQIHFSSSRSTIWHVDDPYVYRILTMDELISPNICLAYPRRAYFERAIVPQRDIGKILKQFKALRFADETIYLRYGSLNIVNGKIGLNFSCDGTHYLNYDEFLAKGLEFWFSGKTFPQAVVPAEALDYAKLDDKIEELSARGCVQINKLLRMLEKENLPEELHNYTPAERDYIYNELKSVMDVYQGGVCGL
ncbi:MAG: PDC sensor domain-containing protein [Gammaproteobacteria bacterium]|nr:PDC sensor domain-containing protein [Gammaproteobacteria bacterium]